MRKYKILPHKDEQGFFGGLYRNKPTPSGCDRWLISLSDNRRFDTLEEAMEAFRSQLKPDFIAAEKTREGMDEG